MAAPGQKTMTPRKTEQGKSATVAPPKRLAISNKTPRAVLIDTEVSFSLRLQHDGCHLDEFVRNCSSTTDRSRYFHRINVEWMPRGVMDLFADIVISVSFPIPVTLRCREKKGPFLATTIFQSVRFGATSWNPGIFLITLYPEYKIKVVDSWVLQPKEDGDQVVTRRPISDVPVTSPPLELVSKEAQRSMDHTPSRYTALTSIKSLPKLRNHSQVPVRSNYPNPFEAHLNHSPSAVTTTTHLN